MADAGQIRDCIFGENWSKADEMSWQLIKQWSELKKDPDLGRANESGWAHLSVS